MSNNSNTTFHIDSKFELVPGKSLGLFKLGDHLFNILNLLKYKPIVHTSSVTIHSINQSVRSNIIVHIKNNNTSLVFNGKNQSLIKIELNLPLCGVELLYQSQVIVRSNELIHKSKLSSIFGPCKSDELNHWPGMKWLLNDNDFTSKLILYNNNFVKKQNLFIDINLNGSFDFKFKDLQQFRFIPLKSNSTDFLITFGQPENVFEKRDKRLNMYQYNDIISNNSDSINDNDNDNDNDNGNDNNDNGNGNDDSNNEHDSQLNERSYFFNYPKLGFDVMFNYENKLKKVIIYNNIPGTPLFQMYNRCPWKLTLKNEQSIMFYDKVE